MEDGKLSIKALDKKLIEFMLYLELTRNQKPVFSGA